MVQNMELIQIQAKLRLLLDDEKSLLAGVVTNEADLEEMQIVLGLLEGDAILLTNELKSTEPKTKTIRDEIEIERVAFMEDCRSFQKDSQFRDRSINSEISIAKSTLLEHESILAADLDVGRRTLESASAERDEVMKRLGDKLEDLAVEVEGSEDELACILEDIYQGNEKLQIFKSMAEVNRLQAELESVEVEKANAEDMMIQMRLQLPRFEDDERKLDAQIQSLQQAVQSANAHSIPRGVMPSMSRQRQRIESLRGKVQQRPPAPAPQPPPTPPPPSPRGPSCPFDFNVDQPDVVRRPILSASPVAQKGGSSPQARWAAWRQSNSEETPIQQSECAKPSQNPRASARIASKCAPTQPAHERGNPYKRSKTAANSDNPKFKPLVMKSHVAQTCLDPDARESSDDDDDSDLLWEINGPQNVTPIK